jgi:DNA-binding MarR family transcriptional regulator
MTKPYYTLANFTGPNALGYLVRRLHNLMVPIAEAQFAGEELTFSHWVALVSLRDRLTHTCADIARHMNHDSGATTRLVDQLEERGLLTRQRSKTDRRVVNLALTAEGKAVAKALTPRIINVCNQALEGMPAAEIDALLANLKRLIARLEEMQPEKARSAR